MTPLQEIDKLLKEALQSEHLTDFARSRILRAVMLLQQLLK